MTRRVQSHGRSLTEPTAQGAVQNELPGAVRVAGALGEREAKVVERIAGVLEVAAWAQRLSHERSRLFRR